MRMYLQATRVRAIPQEMGSPDNILMSRPHGLAGLHQCTYIVQEPQALRPLVTTHVQIILG
jgi:hypothetical protein